MTREGYEALNERMWKSPYSKDILSVLSGGASALIASLYIFTLLFLLLSRDFRIIILICPPLSGFLFVSVARSGLNKKRPYEKYDIVPLIEKEKKGSSFPSRHVASAFLIGVSMIMISPVMALIIIISGFIIAFCRVLSGVHFIADVVFAASFGTAFSLVFVILYFSTH